ncbi:hypothetical protein YC2023_052829 [Brassica napus]
MHISTKKGVMSNYSTCSKPYLLMYGSASQLHHFAEEYQALCIAHICLYFQVTLQMDQDIVHFHRIFHKIHHLCQISLF